MSRYPIVLLAALAFAPAALADGYAPWAQQNGTGVAAGPMRYVAVGTYSTPTTMLTKIDVKTGTVLSSVPVAGSWGIPIFTYGVNTGEGLSHDGKTLVLADLATTLPRQVSKFLFVDPKTLQPRKEAVLKGDFAYDALSPDGSRLYLIQHRNVLDQAHYVVRAYDVRSETLLPGRVADRTQRSWVMDGYPVARTTTADGRWVYTLYGNPDGFPFIHALDTVRGVAHCVGLPWRGSDQAVYNLRLTLHGDSLAVHWLSGKPWYRMSTTTWRLAPDGGGGFPWWALAFLPVATILLAYGRRARTLIAGTARRDRSPARLGSWLPLTRTR